MSCTGLTRQLYNNDGDLNPDFTLQMNGYVVLGSIQINLLDGLGGTADGLIY